MTPTPKSLLEGTTKGPWNASYASNDPKPCWWVYFGDTVLQVPVDENDEPYGNALSEADARLIAAAPDLAAKLEEAERLLTIFAKEQACCGDCPTHQALVDTEIFLGLDKKNAEALLNSRSSDGKGTGSGVSEDALHRAPLKESNRRDSRDSTPAPKSEDSRSARRAQAPSGQNSGPTE